MLTQAPSSFGYTNAKHSLSFCYLKYEALMAYSKTQVRPNN
jgi:hypothetical protein